MQWFACRKAYTHSADRGNLWSTTTNRIDKRQSRLHQRVDFYKVWPAGWHMCFSSRPIVLPSAPADCN